MKAVLLYEGVNYCIVAGLSARNVNKAGIKKGACFKQSLLADKRGAASRQIVGRVGKATTSERLEVILGRGGEEEGNDDGRIAVHGSTALIPASQVPANLTRLEVPMIGQARVRNAARNL